jgi:outer membrane lipoprotein carrier protein
MRSSTALGCALVLLGLSLGAAGAAGAAGAEATGTVLDRYLAGLKSLHTGFRQTVTDAHGVTVEAGAGELMVQRPGRFRWDYQPSGPSTGPGTAPGPGLTTGPATGSAADPKTSGQLLVADGRNLWFYDRELEQATVKPVASVLSPTPVMLLSGTDADLHAQFNVSPGKPHDGLDWVEIEPRSAQADFSRAELGFAGEQLERMLINDRLGQTVRLDFEHSARNAPIDAANFSFVPPAGVDVIGTPQT